MNRNGADGNQYADHTDTAERRFRSESLRNLHAVLRVESHTHHMRGDAMTRTWTALAAAGAIAAAAIAAPTTAEARGWGWGGGAFFGGLAAGAIVGGALAAPYYYGGGPYYYGGGPYYAYAPGYAAGYAYGPGCYLHRERFWDGYGWRVRRVRVCP